MPLPRENYNEIALKGAKNRQNPRKDPKKGSESRQPTGDRERNVGHPNGEEHSRVPKGNGIRKAVAVTVLVVAVVTIVVLVVDDITGVGVADDPAIPVVGTVIVESIYMLI